jgi:flavin-dependent dehydrogenase
MVEYDVIVVGGGPSGSVCARLTAEKGARVLLLDKASFPREKPSRDLALGKQSRVIFEELGIASRLESKPHAKVRGIRFTSPNGKTFSQRLSPSEKGETHGWGIKSTFLDNLLFEHASKVCEFREKTHVVGLLKEGDRVVGVRVADLSTKETKEIRSRVVVGADGISSTVALQLNANDVVPEHALSCVRGYYDNVSALTDEAELYFRSNGVRSQLWITPLENNTCNVGLSVRLADAQKNSIHVPSLFEKILASEPFAARFKDAKLLGSLETWTLAVSSRDCSRAFPGAVLIGDAASLSDSFSNDGLSNQLLSGKLAAETILSALEKNDVSVQQLHEYENALKLHLENDIVHAQHVQTLTAFSPALDFTFAQAANKPALREHLTRAWVNETKTPANEHVSMTGFLKLLFA